MDAVETVETEVRELIRRSGLDPVRETGQVADLVRAAVVDYDERSTHGGLPPLGNVERAVKLVLDTVAGFGPLQQYFDDPRVEEIWINAPPCVGNCLLDIEARTALRHKGSARPRGDAGSVGRAVVGRAQGRGGRAARAAPRHPLSDGVRDPRSIVTPRG
ncbi:type II secretion system protein E [Janibacter hoylei PVAS-1]|uniref:Type II secretion system protein E n=1 Tax=Janibacter hoylei PVAS-1 TaxID=1210046 RepID=K1E5G8_9MICO|nr:type II secretion system protein E [Janibacter hoylei PVAS-1]